MQKKIYVVGMFDDDTAGKVQAAVAAVAVAVAVVFAVVLWMPCTVEEHERTFY